MQAHLQRIDNFLDFVSAHPGMFGYHMYRHENPNRKGAVIVTDLDRQEYENILFNEVLQLMRENVGVKNVIMRRVFQLPDVQPEELSHATILKFIPDRLRRQVYRNAQRRFLFNNFNLLTQFELQEDFDQY